jgi:hypothetical protein
MMNKCKEAHSKQVRPHPSIFWTVLHYLVVANAVEGSWLILVCMSSQYKDSPNCRLEGEYVSRLRKEWIPMKVDGKFSPTGW